MQQRVTAIVVVRSGADYLQRTLDSLAAQTRSPDAIIAIDAGSTDRSRAMLADSDVGALTSAPAESSFGDAAFLAVRGLPPASGDSEWVWLLSHDSAAQPRALEALLAAVEIAPSVAVAGPKSMSWSERDTIREFGETMTHFGRSVSLVEGELDQAQHDVQIDVLGVAAAGMLVRRQVFEGLGGFDPGLPTIDAGLDFCVRARLAGHRVVGVPAARVATAGGALAFDGFAASTVRGATAADRRRARAARAAGLHRRLVYSPMAAVPFHWVTLLPLAIVRAMMHTLKKRPGLILGEFVAALATAFSWRSVGRARAALARSKTAGWATLVPLRLTTREARQRRDLARERGSTDRFERGDEFRQQRERADFLSSGGVWAVIAAGVAGTIASARLLGAESLIGGGLIPLAADPGSLWANVGYGWREIGLGFVGAADPFAVVLALFGSITFWNPSASIVIFTFIAMPLAALGAWVLTRGLVERTWLPALAALLWGVAPSLLASIHSGRLGATIAHVALPYLVLLVLRAPRSWAASAGAALLLALTASGSPSLLPALAIAIVAFAAFRPRAAHRILPVVLPSAVLFAPLVIDQLARGTLIGLLADPGVPVPRAAATGIQLALGAPTGGSNGWTAFLDQLASAGGIAPYIVGVLLLPLALLALATLAIPRALRGSGWLFVALLGYLTAVLASRLDVASAGAMDVGVWPGSGVSLFWLGLVGAAMISLDTMSRPASPGFSVLLGVATVLTIIPLLAPTLIGSAMVEPGGRRILPAFVDAEAGVNPMIGTLVITPIAADTVSASLQRGSGETLDDQSTLDATAVAASSAERDIATLAANLISRSGFDARAVLDAQAIGFVVLSNPSADDPAQLEVATRAREALDSNPEFAPVGETISGLLWRYVDAPESAGLDERPSPIGTTWGAIVLSVQLVVFALTLLLAAPTGQTRRRRAIERASTESSFDGNEE